MSATAHSLEQPLIVMPASGRLESVLFFVAAFVVIASTFAYIALKPKAEGPPPLLSWQVGSFDGLNTVDQAIHSALLPASEEIIWTNNDSGQWPSIDDLAESLLPPFYQDNFWKTNGEVQWQAVMPGANSIAPSEAPQPIQKIAEGLDPFVAPNAVYRGTLGQGTASYYGSGGKIPGQSAYLAVIGHTHSGTLWINQATLWIHKDPNAPFPDILKPEALVSRGWRQIIPYNGTSEVERVKGNS